MAIGDADMDGVFIDTNVLVYSLVHDSRFHAAARRAVDALHSAGKHCWISRQVLREFMAVMSRRQSDAPAFPAGTVATHVRELVRRFRMAEDGAQVTMHLLNLFESNAVSGSLIHDANIVATMLAHRIPCLLTHNLKDFERFSEIITILPMEERT